MYVLAQEPIGLNTLDGDAACSLQCIRRAAGQGNRPGNQLAVNELPDDQKLILEIARVIRLGFLQQNAFHKEDTFVPMEKQLRMMEVILHLYDRCKSLIEMNMPMALLRESDVFEKIIAIKYDVPNKELQRFESYDRMIEDFYQHLMATNA